MPSREQIIQQALSLARKRFADGGVPVNEEYMRWLEGGGLGPPPSTEATPSLPGADPSTALPSAPPSYSTSYSASYSTPSAAPSRGGPASVAPNVEDTSVSALGPSPFGTAPSSVAPLSPIEEGKVGPTDVFGSMVGIRGAAQNPTDVEAQEGVSSQTSSPGAFGNLAGAQSVSQQSVGPYSFGEATQTSFGPSSAPGFGEGISPSGPYGSVNGSFVGGIPSSQQLDYYESAPIAEPAPTEPVGYVTTDQMYGPQAVEQYFTPDDLSSKTSLRADMLDPDLPAPDTYDVGPASYGGLEAASSEAAAAEAAAAEANAAADDASSDDAGIGDDNGAPGGYSDAGIGDDNGAPGDSYGGYGGDDAGSYGGGDDSGSEGGSEGGDGGADGGGDGGSDGGGDGGSDGGGDGGGGGDGEKRGGRILKDRPDVSKALSISVKKTNKGKKNETISRAVALARKQTKRG